MTTAFGNLYQRVILQYCRKQDHVGRVLNPTHAVKGKNQMCGDVIEITARIGLCIDEIRFFAEGCALLKASAALMAESFNGLNVKEAESLCFRFLKLLESDSQFQEGIPNDLLIFSGIHHFPLRLQCVRLPWDTFLGRSIM